MIGKLFFPIFFFLAGLIYFSWLVGWYAKFFHQMLDTYTDQRVLPAKEEEEFLQRFTPLSPAWEVRLRV